MQKIILSHSQLAVARECPRKYQHMYVSDRVPVAESAALSFGRLWHEVMELWWNEGPEDAVQYLLSVADRIDPATGAQMAAMLAHYQPPIEQRWDVVGVESQITVPIRSPETGRQLRGAEITMRIDAMVTERSTGELWLVEHKTTSDDIIGFGPFWQRLAIDAQVGIYLLGTGAAGVVYDVVRKPRIKLCGKDEQQAVTLGILPGDAYQRRIEEEIAQNPDVYYQLREIRKTPDDLVEAQWDLYQQTQILLDQRRHGRFPRNANACRGLYGVCPFLPVCTGEAQLEDEAMYRDKWAA